MLRALLPFTIALTLLLSLPSQANAVLVSASPKTQVPAFLEGDSESRIGLLCHNDPVNHTDPTGLDPTRDFLAGAGDLITFGQGSKLVEAIYPGYNATVDTDSGAYRAGQVTGLVLGMTDGAGEVRIAKAAITGEKLLPTGSKVLAKVERQLAEHGEKSLQKSLTSFEKRIAEHAEKIEQAKAAGANTSSMQREMRAFEKERDAIKQVLKKKNE